MEWGAAVFEASKELGNVPFCPLVSLVSLLSPVSKLPRSFSRVGRPPGFP